MIFQGSALGLALILLSGCGEFGKKKEAPAATSKEAEKSSGLTLCTIDGKPAISEADFLTNLNQMLQSNPYFRGATVESLPKELLRRFLDQLTSQKLIENFSIKNNIEKDAEFIKAYEETEKLLRRSLMVQIFEKKIYDGIKVADGDISKYYAENKDRFVKVAGGVLAMGISFDSDAKATEFLAKAKGNVEGFEKLAKAEKAGKFKDFNRVNKESKGFQYDVVPAPVKETVLGMTKLPGVEKIKAGKEFWVVKAWDKKDTTLFEMSEVKTHIESMIKNNQFKDALEKRVKELKDDFKVVVNEEYFKEKQQDKKDAKEEDAANAPAPKAEEKAAAATA